jgi:holo-[acyl-carrier protein] synthase
MGIGRTRLERPGKQSTTPNGSILTIGKNEKSQKNRLGGVVAARGRTRYSAGMDILGLGLDVIELDRVRGVYQRHGSRFLERVYTAPERERAARLKDPAPFLAGRFAAKEAILKVLGTGLSQGLSWQHVVVLREPTGAPRVCLRGKALERAEKLGLGKILLTISHSKGLAVAHAMGVSGDSSALRYPE